jgi:hypothetical protein
VVVVVVEMAVVVVVVGLLVLERNLGGSEAIVEAGGATSIGASVVALYPSMDTTRNTTQEMIFMVASGQ